MVVYDTAVVDLTQELEDPVDLLFGVQLDGGTDIHSVTNYQQINTNRLNTILLLITGLYEEIMPKVCAKMRWSWYQQLCN